MGTTLQNGVYLPNEGERNCYAGLKTNWEILDQKVADVTALQQAVAGALHRQIVTQLPTEDIDPNTIYMILSGTSATENVYNEYMYVNNAWELIGTSATDLTNYYTKSEVDGKLLLKANASDLTSHTGDTTIHVTASDKSKWNTVALIKQLRLVNAQVGSSTTIAFANIDDTNGIKVGDKCMDLDAKMFEITAVDTTNQTVTVGSALVDLALDANVVHTSGNETISGQKVFTDINAISSSAEIGVSGGGNSFKVLDKNKKTLSRLDGGTFSTGMAYSQWLVNNGSDEFNGVSLYQPSANLVQLRPYSSALSVQLGTSNKPFSDCYTSKINGLTPSSLGMPSDRSARIDISSYFTNTGTGNTNDYSVPANGFIFLNLLNAFVVICYSIDGTNNVNYAQSYFRPVDGQIYILFPVRKNDIFRTLWTANGGTITVTGAYFIPCQGNV